MAAPIEVTIKFYSSTQEYINGGNGNDGNVVPRVGDNVTIEASDGSTVTGSVDHIKYTYGGKETTETCSIQVHLGAT